MAVDKKLHEARVAANKKAREAGYEGPITITDRSAMPTKSTDMTPEYEKKLLEEGKAKPAEDTRNLSQIGKDTLAATGDLIEAVASGAKDMAKGAAQEQRLAKAAAAKGASAIPQMGEVQVNSKAQKNDQIVEQSKKEAEGNIEARKEADIKAKKQNIETGREEAAQLFNENMEEATDALQQSLANATTGDTQAIEDTKAGFEALSSLFQNMSWDNMKPADYDKLEYATILSKGIEKMFGVPATDFTQVSKDVALKKMEEMANTAQKLIDIQTAKENTKTQATAENIATTKAAKNENIAKARDFDLQTVNDTIDAATNAEGKMDIESFLDTMKSIGDENTAEFLANLSNEQQRVLDVYEANGGVDAAMLKGYLKAVREGQMTDREMLSKILEAAAGVVGK